MDELIFHKRIKKITISVNLILIILLAGGSMIVSVLDRLRQDTVNTQMQEDIIWISSPGCWIGFWSVPEKAASGDIMTHTMFALAKAKETPPDRIWFYDSEVHKQEQLENYIESHMNQALTDGEFKLFLQPKMYSSLNVLGKLNIDELKLDKGFLTEASDLRGERQRAVMEQIVELSKRLRISTVAEGVESAEHEAYVRILGCDFGQGYYYSRPLEAEEFNKKYMRGREE